MGVECFIQLSLLVAYILFLNKLIKLTEYSFELLRIPYQNSFVLECFCYLMFALMFHSYEILFVSNNLTSQKLTVFSAKVRLFHGETQ